jgi:hypothetical protein
MIKAYIMMAGLLLVMIFGVSACGESEVKPVFNPDDPDSEESQQALRGTFEEMLENKIEEYSKQAAIDSKNTDEYMTERCELVREWRDNAEAHILAIDQYVSDVDKSQDAADRVYSTGYGVSTVDGPFRAVLIWVRDNMTQEQQEETSALILRSDGEIDFRLSRLATLEKGHLENSVKWFGLVLAEYWGALGYHRDDQSDGAKRTARGDEKERMDDVTDFLVEGIPAINMVFEARCGSDSGSLTSVPPLPLFSGTE